MESHVTLHVKASAQKVNYNGFGKHRQIIGGQIRLNLVKQ